MQTWGTTNALQFLKWVTIKDSAPLPSHPFMSCGHILSQKLSCHPRLRLGFRLRSYPVISLQGLGGNLKARFASNLELVCVYSQLFLLLFSGSFSTLMKKQNKTKPVMMDPSASQSYEHITPIEKLLVFPLTASSLSTPLGGLSCLEIPVTPAPSAPTELPMG